MRSKNKFSVWLLVLVFCLLFTSLQLCFIFLNWNKSNFVQAYYSFPEEAGGGGNPPGGGEPPFGGEPPGGGGAVCGANGCEAGEDCSNCPQDCGSCSPPPPPPPPPTNTPIPPPTNTPVPTNTPTPTRTPTPTPTPTFYQIYGWVYTEKNNSVSRPEEASEGLLANYLVNLSGSQTGSYTTQGSPISGFLANYIFTPLSNGIYNIALAVTPTGSVFGQVEKASPFHQT